ncbi:hypothetical protein NGM99_00265 [Mesorhizobium sp. RP14(2022)]|uniref:Two pore domain potassium channel family protein n=1 Tax=Mesorhizobium liriopis TaxID=2953882 RepID=A0ABT1C067_9HYPH|nr:hypothetical protein [Mesorhizobium liriopis]MCO6048222.1 hypothetical protein [Mesorhizobium liriopis]
MTLEQIIGTALVLLFLSDIFLTVLYARAGTGLLAPSWNRAIWTLLRAVAALSGGRRGTILSLAGPLIVVFLIGFWALGLTVGAALVIHPELGTAIRPSSGQASSDFVTALFVAGSSLSIVGGSDYAPHTAGTRMLFLVNSLIGGSVLTLVLSFLVQVYSALRERNALALMIDLTTDGTGDAAQMLARLMPSGECGNASSELGNLARSLAATKEAHHFYPLLFYFSFEEPRYSLARFSFVLLDLVTLIETTLDRSRYVALINSAAVTSLRQGAFLLIETLDRIAPTADEGLTSAVEHERDRQSYIAATHTLAGAGIAVRQDGFELYIAARQMWEPLALRVGAVLGYPIHDIDRRRHEVGQANAFRTASN